jgi:hypothetical protein
MSYWLGNNAISDVGAVEVAGVLKHNQHLLKINLGKSVPILWFAYSYIYIDARMKRLQRNI